MNDQKYLKYFSISLIVILALIITWPKPLDICKEGFHGLKELVFGGVRDEIDKVVTSIVGDTGEVITVKSDSAQVLQISDAADLHVCSQEMQDYAVEKQIGKCRDNSHKLVSFGEEEHKLVLIVQEKCYYNVNLKNVRYVTCHEDSTIYVTMPQLEDRYDFIDETDIPDEKDFWADFSRNNLRYTAKKKIKANFNSAENRKLARQRASYLVKNIVSQLVNGEYKVVVVSEIEQKREIQ